MFARCASLRVDRRRRPHAVVVSLAATALRAGGRAAASAARAGVVDDAAWCLFVSFSPLLFGCARSYVVVQKQKIDESLPIELKVKIAVKVRQCLVA